MTVRQFPFNFDSQRAQALAWAVANFDFVAFFQHNVIGYPQGAFPNRLAVANRAIINLNDPVLAPADVFSALPGAARQSETGLVGFLGYDLKNQLEALQSRHPNRLGFADALFFAPEILLDFSADSVTIQALDPAWVLTQILAQPTPATNSGPQAGPVVQARVSPSEYEQTVRRIQEYIRQGDVYELNYCIEFFTENTDLEPITLWWQLNERSPMPFSVFLKVRDNYLLCASPERFMQKTGNVLISQPIKGTIRRGQSPAEDEALRQQLRDSEKEQAENLMIVDLVRNDLARSAQTGSVAVDELFGVYSFRQVHQMISTVRANLRPGLSWADALRHAFPMGSMTGAPKIRAMQLIDELETSRRGLFSGAVGLVTPTGDFDFNVVIRSLQYDARSRYTSFSVGSAITYDADPMQEYDECLLKASALRSVLAGE